MEINTEVLVIGSGPGGYTAAFRAADLGKQVTLVEYHAKLGGVCLNVGCIPSKALLHAVQILEETQELAAKGIFFAKPKIDPAKLRAWVVNKTINKLNVGLRSLATLRKIQVITGRAEFVNANKVAVMDRQGQIVAELNFQHCILAVGSRPITLADLPQDPRIMDSTQALELAEIPENLLIIGGGIIGMELGTVYSALGTKVSVVELTKQLLIGADRDLVAIWQQRMQTKFVDIFLDTKVNKVIPEKKHLTVEFIGEFTGKVQYERILCAIGRRPNTDKLELAKIGLAVDQRGFIPVDQQMRTNIGHIFAIGDVVGHPMLAHKAIPEGKIAAEVICGKPSYFDTKLIPSVAYTIPEVAWVGLTEEQAKVQNIKYTKAVFPWSASGRALATSRSEGSTKILFDPVKRTILGGAIVGYGAGELISEISIAIEMGMTAEDLEAIIHPHPTISESIVQAAEIFTGTITDLPNVAGKG